MKSKENEQTQTGRNQKSIKDAARETGFAVPFPRGGISFVRAQLWKIWDETLRTANS